MNPTTLTPKGIPTLISSSSTSQTPVILQVLNLQDEVKEVKNGQAFVSEVSDGYTKITCYWGTGLFERIREIKKKLNGAIVLLTQYMPSSKKVLVSAFDIIYLLDQEIGTPIPYKSYLEGDLNLSSTNLIDETKVIRYHEPQKKNAQRPSQPVARTDGAKQSTTKLPIASMERLKIKDSAEYQTIEQLYSGMDNWRLFCRVNKCNFREFSNKKGGTTQLLEFELRDKNDWTIKCTIFGEHAVKMSKIIQEGEVYTFSQGIIKVDTYKTPAHPKDSQYTINFTEHSKIQLAINDSSIKEKQNTYQTIQSIKDWKVNGEIDLACIVKQVKPQSVFVNKTTDETHPKKTVVVCDPVTNMEIQVTLWRNLTNLINSSMEGKTVALESFKVHQYNGKLSLTGGIKSRVIQLKNHSLRKFEGKVKSTQFQSLSFKKDESGERQNITSVKNLLKQAENLREKQTIWSTFRVYINRTKDKGKKWYSGCPSNTCKRAVTEDDIKCSHCGKAFDKPTYRYILGMQVSDCLGTGSVWTTGYDDFTSKILSFDQDIPAQRAKNLSQQQFSQIAKRCLFQQFKVTMNSKLQYTPEHSAKVRHQVSSFKLVDNASEARSNLQRIRSLMV